MSEHSERLATEQERTDAFEELCGGVYPAQRLFHIWKTCWPPNKEASFCMKALKQGFTAAQISALIDLQ